MNMGQLRQDNPVQYTLKNRDLEPVEKFPTKMTIHFPKLNLQLKMEMLLPAHKVVKTVEPQRPNYRDLIKMAEALVLVRKHLTQIEELKRRLVKIDMNEHIHLLILFKLLFRFKEEKKELKVLLKEMAVTHNPNRNFLSMQRTGQHLQQLKVEASNMKVSQR